ncbi:hypothetical protein Csa_014903 [Cucumis sativus]|uniref:Uncharacterized protein n=1 Tax=Cucumis sativus TaxID=3659 RepID=A0A0A0KV00_CUCSA|nr:hypothetical protein Csa_014903 [Cucumis sativus]
MGHVVREVKSRNIAYSKGVKGHSVVHPPPPLGSLKQTLCSKEPKWPAPGPTLILPLVTPPNFSF